MNSKPDVAIEPAVQQGRWPEMKRGRPMSLGLMLPTAEQNAVANESPRDGFWDTIAMAKLALDVGFDMLWLPDHFILKLDRHGGEARGVWDCWTTAAGIAAALPDTPLGTMVAATSFHNPGSIARMAESIDEISRGNFVLGLGCGWHEPEYEMYGFPFDHRVDRFAEAMQIISPLVRTGHADFKGTYYQASDAVNLPRGPRWREGGPPIIMGANKPRMMQLTARYADAWNSDWLARPEDIQPMVSELDKACAEIGRDPETLIRTSSTRFSFDDDADDPMLVHGAPEEMAATLHAYANLGMRQHLVSLDPRTVDNFERFAKVIDVFDRG